jgi:hypothetical protein
MPRIHPLAVAKIVLAIALLLALAPLPYAYYQLLRWAVCGVAAFSAYQAYEKQKNAWMWIFGALAVLFNPIVPIYLSKQVWAILDVISAIILFTSLFFHAL